MHHSKKEPILRKFTCCVVLVSLTGCGLFKPKFEMKDFGEGVTLSDAKAAHTVENCEASKPSTFTEKFNIPVPPGEVNCTVVNPAVGGVAAYSGLVTFQDGVLESVSFDIPAGNFDAAVRKLKADYGRPSETENLETKVTKTWFMSAEEKAERGQDSVVLSNSRDKLGETLRWKFRGGQLSAKRYSSTFGQSYISFFDPVKEKAKAGQPGW